MAPKLASITGWQEDRRRALVLLRTQHQRALRRFAHEEAWALAAAARDVLDTLRDRAAADIAEGCEMRWAHERVQVAA